MVSKIWHQFNGLVELGVSTVVIAAHEVQIARFLLARDHGAQFDDERPLFGRPDIGQPRYGGENIDSRVTSLVGGGAIQHDVPVERATNVVGNRFVMVVAIDEQRRKCR